MLMMIMQLMMMIICVWHVTPERPCHMLPWAARYSISDGKGTSNLKRKMGPRPKFERAQVLQRCAAWVWPLSLGAEDLICC